MSYEYTVDKNGTISGINHSIGFRQERQKMSEKDSKFLERVLYSLDGDSHYNVEIIADLQRQYGTKLLTGLLNGIFNYRDKMLEELNSRQNKLDNMVYANEQLLEKVKLLEGQVEQLKVQNNQLNNEVDCFKGRVKMAKTLKDEEINKKIIELHQMGISQKKIGAMLGISNSRVNVFLKNWRAQNNM